MLEVTNNPVLAAVLQIKQGHPAGCPFIQAFYL